MRTGSPISQSRGETNTRVLIIVGAIVIVVILAVYLLRPQPEPIPVPIPETGQPIEAVEPAKSAEERGDTARDIVARLKENPGGPDYAEAHEHAQEYLADGRLADAQLLYFFAARGAHAPAAFDLATFNDPNHATATSGLVAEPDPFQAYRWYTTARDAGYPGASERLDELRVWAESASASGDADAERLLLQWEQGP